MGEGWGEGENVFDPKLPDTTLALWIPASAGMTNRPASCCADYGKPLLLRPIPYRSTG